MTQSEIIEMAVQAGMRREVMMLGRNVELLEAFAKIVAQSTFEEVAKEFDKMPFGDTAASFAVFVRNMKK